MCTVSWLEQPGGYRLFCNRDEKKTRGAALPPELHLRDDVRFISPSDADHGGSWIAVNEFGLCVCLLNGDHPALGLHAPRRRSRGYVVLDIVTSSSPGDSLARLRREDLRAFDPFVLLLIAPGHPAVVARWNGALLRTEPACVGRGLLTSSSYDSSNVRSARQLEWSKHRLQSGDTPATLRHFHACHGVSASAYSPCMHRDDAETVSFSEIHVSPNEIRFSYSPAAPCRQTPGNELLLLRAA